MGNKFLITLCLAVLLQDSMGSLGNRSYNPRFRNVNKKYLKAESENGFENREITEEILANADVILVSVPEENSANELADYQKENRHHTAGSGQHKTKKPIHASLPEADSPIIRQNKPVVLQLLGWTGNPPPPVALPPMPFKESEIVMAKPDMDDIAVPIEIKEEVKPVDSMVELVQENKQEWIQKPEAMPVVVVEDIVKEEAKPVDAMAELGQENKQEWSQKPEAMSVVVVEDIIKEEVKPVDSMVELVQENKQEWSQKPEAMPVVVLEEKIMNEEPSILVEIISEDKKKASASENFEKPTEIKDVEEQATILTQIPAMQDAILETAPLILEPISKAEPEMVLIEDKKETAPLILESISKPESEIIVIEDKKEASKTKPQKIQDAIIANMKLNHLGSADMKKQESASNAVQEPSIVFDLIPENLLVMSDVPMSEMIEGEDKMELSQPEIEIISEKIDSVDAITPAKDADKPAKSEVNEKVIEMASAISEMMSEHKKDQLPAFIPLASEKVPESIVIVESVPEMSLPMAENKDKIESKPEEMAMQAPIVVAIKENIAAENSFPMAENKDKMESKPEEMAMQAQIVAAIKENIAAANSFPMAENKDKMESKPEGMAMQAPIVAAIKENIAAESSFPMAENKPEEIAMQAPIVAAIKENIAAENSFPMAENKDKMESKPEEIAMQVPLKVVMKENSAAQSSSPVFQKPIIIESKLDSIPAKPASLENPEKIIEAENSLILNTRARPVRPKPISSKKPGKKPGQKPSKTPVATTPMVAAPTKSPLPIVGY